MADMTKPNQVDQVDFDEKRNDLKTFMMYNISIVMETSCDQTIMT